MPSGLLQYFNLIILLLCLLNPFDAQANQILTTFLQQAREFDGQNNADWSPILYVFEDDPITAEMVLVPVGSFIMGSDSGIPNEMPAHEQRIEIPFWLDRTEATRAQYGLCVDAEACRAALPSENATQPAQPINNVTWSQAQDYCVWRGMRLPTEREWEFSARGVESWLYPWGDTWQPDLAVWWADDSPLEAAFVGSIPRGASWVGALDMAGNMWEWTSSLERYYPYSPTTHEAEKSRLHRVLRGGAFGTRSENNLRAAARFAYLPNAAYDGAGIRCVRDID